MKSGLMTVHQNDPENFIDKPEDLPKHLRWLLIEQEGTNIKTSITKSRYSKIYEG